MKKVVVNPCADGVVSCLPFFLSSVAIAIASTGIVELEISPADEGTMVNSRKPGCFVIDSEGSANQDSSNTCLVGAGVKKHTL